MITPIDIVTHLQRHIPAVLPDFANIVTPTSVSVTGTTVSVTAPAHGLTTGNSIISIGGTFRNPITTVLLNSDGTSRLTTEFDHDFTEPKATDDPRTLTFAGFNEPAWNATFAIDNIPNRRNIEITTPAGQTVAPTGSGYVLEPRPAGLAGTHTVTVQSVNEFTFNVSGAPAFPTGLVDGVQFLTQVNVAGALDADRAIEVYTENSLDQPWLFVIMTGTEVSKDRHTYSDAVAAFTPQDMQKQTLLQNFATVAIFPTDKSLTGFDVSARAHGEIFERLLGLIYGFSFADATTATDFVAVSNGHGPGIYNTAFYSHVYEWQLPSTLTFEDGFLQRPNVAFRDISTTWKVSADDMAQLTANIDLDRMPLT